MRTVLISGSGDAPPPLRDIVQRGSTSFAEHRAAELPPDAAVDADRIVFWTSSPDAALDAIAERYARAEAAERRESLVFVAPDESAIPAAVASPNERYVWPRDEDRLAMAFLTGA